MRKPLVAVLALAILLPLTASTKSRDWGTTHDLFVRASFNESGLYYTSSKQVKLRLAYRWIAVRGSAEWKNINQIVTGLSLSF